MEGGKFDFKKAQRELIRALMQTPFAQWPKQARLLQDEDFDCPACRRALALLKEAEAQGRQTGQAVRPGWRKPLPG